jgi:acyl-CoA thioester hydrolase
VVVHLGRTSVTYRVGIFRGRDPLAAAVLDFTHAYVDPIGRKNIGMPESARKGFEKVFIRGLEKAKL